MEVETNENEEKKPESEKTEVGFKKPVLLVGKLGRCPRKLTPVNADTVKKNKEEAVESTTTQDSSAESTEENKSSDSQAEEISPDGIVSYKEPEWGGLPTSSSRNYTLEVLKSGSIVEVIDLMSKSHWIFGRMKNCDISMQHPTISRYHAVLQYRIKPTANEEPGFYLYDMNSTHGTFLNKKRLRSQSYTRVKVGHMIKFGCSTRSYILTGPDEDTEEESELTVTELQKKKLENVLKAQEAQRQKEQKEEQGVDWGMGDDADEETDLAENPFAQTNNEELYIEDPKKALRGFMEREGFELEYDCTEQRMGEYLCKVMLPLDDQLGRPIYAEVLHKGKKKEAVVQCALEACRILDRHGVLRQATHESRKRKSKDWEANDYYDSDEDTFLDRTGTIERKRANRMKAKNPEQQVETYNTLSQKETELKKAITDIEHQLQKTKKQSNDAAAANEEDSLESYMKSLKEPELEKQTISRLKSELIKLKQDYAQVTKLLNLAKPAELPSLVPQGTSQTESAGKSKLLPMFGKKKKIKVELPTKSAVVQPEHVGENEEEEVEAEEEVNKSELVSVDTEENKSNTKEESKPIIKKTEEVKEQPNTSKSSAPRKKQNEEKNRSSEKKQSEKVKKRMPKGYSKDGYKEDYSMWVPPTNQSGDGRTSLNDKLGY